MGLAARYVNESVRLWQVQGLHFVLDGQRSTPLEPEKPVRQQGAKQTVRPPSPSTTPAPRPHPAQQKPPKPAALSGFYSLGQAREDGQIPDDLFAHLGKQPTPVFSVWTYWEFPQDLTTAALAQRKELWANIYKAIVQPGHWGKNSVAFWSLSRNQSGKLLPDTDLFQAGLRYLAPVYIFCFGRKAFSTLLPETDYACGQFLYGRYALVSLPGPEEMLPDNRDIKASVWQTLQHYQPTGRTT